MDLEIHCSSLFRGQMDTAVDAMCPVCVGGCEIVRFPHLGLLVFALLCESMSRAAGSALWFLTVREHKDTGIDLWRLLSQAS